MKTIITTLSLLTLLTLPLSGAAATTTSVDLGTDTATTTAATTSSLQEIQQLLNTEKVSHPEISLDFGVRQRFSSSPSGAADIKMTPAMVYNSQFLKAYVQKLILTEPIRELAIAERELSVTIGGRAQLLGVIPVRVPYEISTDLDPKLQELTVTQQKTWWSWLATKPSAETVAKKVRANLSGQSFLSRVQLAAYVLEASLTALEN